MYILLTILLILLIIMIYKKYNAKQLQGFTQDCDFSLKTNKDIYDDFYSNIYDNIHKPKKYLQQEYTQVIEVIKPPKNSVVLEIGCKTGDFLNLLSKNYTSHGLEESKSLINVAKNKYPELSIYNRALNNNQIFDKNTFSHIFVRDFMVYTIYDKPQFFSNCYYWLQPSGLLIIHLVNKKKYNPLVEIANHNTNPQKYSKERITKCEVVNPSINYQQKTNFMDDNRVVVTETFTDVNSQKTRQNEMTLYMDDIQTIEKQILRAGFSSHGLFSLEKDNQQFIYIFKKNNY